MPGTARTAAALSIGAVALLSIIYASMLSSQQQPALPRSFTVSGHAFNFSAYAVTEQQREQGLMNRTVTNSTFMLFVFPSVGVYPFWMYDTYNSLDMIWINGSLSSGGTVVYVAEDAPPCVGIPPQNCAVYNPKGDANYVIEARAGFAADYGVAEGSTVTFGR